MRMRPVFALIFLAACVAEEDPYPIGPGGGCRADCAPPAPCVDLPPDTTPCERESLGCGPDPLGRACDPTREPTDWPATSDTPPACSDLCATPYCPLNSPSCLCVVDGELIACAV